MMRLKRLRLMARQVIGLFGLEVVREPHLRLRWRRDRYGVDPLADIQRLLHGCDHPVIFDVGANVGQSIVKFRDVFPKSMIHSFEPSPTTFARLRSRWGNVPAVKAWNMGVGAADTTMELQENSCPDMSSFLPLGRSSWGEVVRTTTVNVVTLDTFARENGVTFIHLLKSDTQGFDLEVFKGAGGLLKENRIGLIFCEIIFSPMYQGLPRFLDILRYLDDHNFEVVGFYEQHFTDGLVSWADALFINREFYRQRMIP